MNIDISCGAVVSAIEGLLFSLSAVKLVMFVIAELLSQLSNVRSRTAAAQSVSSQLQQLEMQLHSSRSVHHL
jgi:hypothetical protein